MTDDDTPAGLLELFHWLEDPSIHPTRTKIREFSVDYIHSKGSEGGDVEEGLTAFCEAVLRDPESWPVPHDRLQALWRETWRLPDHLPPLARPAQLVWLGIEIDYDEKIIDAALYHEFRPFTPVDDAKAWREASDHFKREATAKAITAAIFQAWHDIEKAKGRPEGELLFGDCIAALGIVTKRDDGSQYLDFNKLKDIVDPELRRAVVGAAWKADQEARRRAAPRTPRH
jgi:hypothetical protein